MANNFGSEAITVVAGSAIGTYWLLIPNGNNLYSYRIDNSGFSNGNPVVSNLSFPVNLGFRRFYSIKASPNLNNQNFSNFICVSHWVDTSSGAYNLQNYNRVMSFNSATGAINNAYSLNVNSYLSYLPEFNKDVSVLFLGNTSIYAIDLQNSTTGNVNSLQIFYSPPTPNPHDLANYASLQRNNHGDVYISKHNSSFLGKINNPDVYGANMSVTMNSINLGAGRTVFGLPQLLPENKKITYYPCIDSLTLTSEPNLTFNYEVGNKITTKDNYIIGSRHNITMKAGQSINLLLGTHMQSGTNYHAYIARCIRDNTTSKISNANHNQKEMVLNLDMEERKALDKQIDIFPNPASTYINIDSGNEKITSWELVDISGRSILKGSSTQVNVQSLPKATYLLKINTATKQVTKKVIVK
ncbi:MAG: T9SS type A sorting domain-containing protein [Chryseobacterium sp.]|nr:MAG: T9SS type A sorting domain-containing protein [Chryseobacterium sp.]